MRIKVDETGCWLWLGKPDAAGYGVYKGAHAHRASYELFVGRIPADYHVHHRCSVRLCVNPAHLEALPPTDHHKLHARKKDHCIWGHPFDERNTYITSKGERQCRACKNRRERERLRRLRDAAIPRHEQT